MRILGLDPGTAITGYGIIDALDGELVSVTYGVIRTHARDRDAFRLRQIFLALNDLITTYRPDAAAVEQVFFGRNVTTAITVGQARGVLLLALENANIPIAEYSPPKIKETIVGYGNADKAQMQLMVRHLLHLDKTPQPDDAADGLAVAMTHYHYHRYESL
ncbi:MAG: crossover junction endodeoxyribonuclease RuvC [Anaerolineales bacterium]|nr:crossover junction endodeoxyribonuclease RuvC [Anaerolineales bacterium]MCB8953177.1 crossover junction endodeoxyribonuclease RuvC [Ardenticatenales bacterium]